MKKKRNWTKTILFLAVLSVSILGISYAGWNELLIAKSTMGTGNIGMVFTEDPYSLDNPTGIQDLKLELDSTGTEAAISAKVEPDYTGDLTLTVKNSGELSVLFYDGKNTDGIEVAPNAAANLTISIHKDFSGEVFKYTAANGAWEKHMRVNGTFEVLTVTTPDAIIADLGTDPEIEPGADTAIKSPEVTSPQGITATTAQDGEGQ